jgi:tRNA(adenine34) deaminase
MTHPDAPPATSRRPALPTDAERAAMTDAVDRALRAARQDGKAGIAAAVLKDGRVVAVAENEVEIRSDPTRHAELVAIGRACAALGTTDLSGCVVVSTLQPCEMCLAALRFAGVARVVFAARQERVAPKYFAFPHLSIEAFRNGGDFEVVAGLEEERVLHLYETGAE